MALNLDNVLAVLARFGLALSSTQGEQLLAYVELLMRWNRRINLVGSTTPEECVSRHFGESLYLSRWVQLRGANLDVGSGAGFPGLALKIVFPGVAAMLLEPVAKKRAFLKEAARVCGMTSVEVRPERLEQYVHTLPRPAFESLTSRAVGGLETLIPQAISCLKPGGKLCLWAGEEQISRAGQLVGIVWSPPIPIPQTQRRQIRIGSVQ
jgi:16S rRNA (guanine527-N7)-methyltransferase